MDWQAIVKTVAPWIGGALGGPLGAVAVNAAAQALGVSDKTVDAIKNAISGATQEQLLALKEADNAFSLQMQELGFKNAEALEKIAADDRASAREREIKTGDSLTPRILAILISAGFFGVLGLLLVNGKPAEGGDALLLMLGALGAAWGCVVNYFFGSSSGSAAKNQMLDRVMANKGAA
jgi:hypothetical protein